MLDYYTAIDRAWTAMPIHATILGNALTAAPHLLTDKLQKEAAAAFTAAERQLPKIADPAARNRAAAALRRERVLFSQWQDLRRLGADTARLNLPLLADAPDFASSASGVQQFAPAGGAEGFSTRVSAAWTKDALLVKWTCRDAEINNLKAVAARHDDKVVEDDAVELVLS